MKDSTTATIDFQRYLTAKEALDNVSLHPRPLAHFTTFLTSLSPQSTLLDLGSGAGAMLRRVQPHLPALNYHALDHNRELLNALVEYASQTPLSVTTHCRDLIEFLTNPPPVPFSAVLSHMFIDLVAVAPALSAITAITQPGAYLYFSAVYSGKTDLIPSHPLDSTVVQYYHASMHHGAREGARAGTELLEHALSAESHRLEIVDCAPSDWVVLPSAQGYAHGSQEVLNAILYFIESTLHSIPEAARDPAVAHWISERRTHLKRGALGLINHQLDILLRRK